MLILLLCACTLLLGCSDDENPLIDLNNSSTLSDSYRTASLIDKVGLMGLEPGITIIAGGPVTIQLELRVGFEER